jgi:hypothetical protein
VARYERGGDQPPVRIVSRTGAGGLAILVAIMPITMLAAEAAH